MSKTITRKYIQRITKREGNTNIRQSSGGGGGGGGGASQYWVEENYISKLFFNQLFTVYDEDGNVVEPNDTESVIASIKSMFGFWTDAYLSALGNGEGGGAELTLASLADVYVHGVANGQALVYDAYTQKWVPGQAGLDPTSLWQELGSLGTEQISSTHLTTALSTYNPTNNFKTINGNSIIGTGDINVGGGGGSYLPLSGGTLTGRLIINYDHTGTPSSFYIKSVATNTGLGFGDSESNNNSAYVKFKSTSYNSGSQNNRFAIDFYGNDNVFNILANGNVGIGTTSPEKKLDVNGDVRANGKLTVSYSTDEQILISGSFTSGISGYSHAVEAINPSLSSGEAYLFDIGRGKSNSNTAYFGYVYVGQNTSYATIGLYGHDRILNVTASEKVGIGTSSPTKKLDVNGDVIASTSLSSTDWVSDNGQIVCHASNTNYFLGMAATKNGYGVIQGGNSGTGAISILINPNGGNVGIGTTSPSYKLHVAGVAYASTGFYSGGYVTALSDARHKDVKGDVGLTVSEVANAPSVKFLWKDRRQEGLQVGSIAQYWQKVMPEAIVKNADGELTMSYGVIALLASIATARKVEDHERRIRELEEENKKLKQQLNAA